MCRAERRLPRQRACHEVGLIALVCAAVGAAVLVVTAVCGMPHCRSAYKVAWNETTAAQRRRLLRDAWYCTSHSSVGMSFLEVPSELKSSIKKMATAKATHLLRERTIGRSTAHARDASLAAHADGCIDDDTLKCDMHTYRAGNTAKHTTKFLARSSRSPRTEAKSAESVETRTLPCEWGRAVPSRSPWVDVLDSVGDLDGSSDWATPRESCSLATTCGAKHVLRLYDLLPCEFVPPVPGPCVPPASKADLVILQDCLLVSIKAESAKLKAENAELQKVLEQNVSLLRDHDEVIKGLFKLIPDLNAQLCAKILDTDGALRTLSATVDLYPNLIEKAIEKVSELQAVKMAIPPLTAKLDQVMAEYARLKEEVTDLQTSLSLRPVQYWGKVVSMKRYIFRRDAAKKTHNEVKGPKEHIEKDKGHKHEGNKVPKSPKIPESMASPAVPRFSLGSDFDTCANRDWAASTLNAAASCPAFAARVRDFDLVAFCDSRVDGGDTEAFRRLHGNLLMHVTSNLPDEPVPSLSELATRLACLLPPA